MPAPKANLDARMDVAYEAHGAAITTTIVATTRTSSSVHRTIVAQTHGNAHRATA